MTPADATPDASRADGSADAATATRGRLRRDARAERRSAKTRHGAGAHDTGGAGDSPQDDQPAGSEVEGDAQPDDPDAQPDDPDAAPADTPPSAHRALAWLPESAAAPHPTVPFDTSPVAQVSLPLLPTLPRRGVRPRQLAPLGLVVLLVVAYCTTMMLWPLYAVAPTIAAADVTPTAAPAAAMTWPADGAAGVGVAGIGAPVASTADQSAIASLTKTVTALLVMSESPVTAQNQGPEFWFDQSDSDEYWSYLRRNESALDVPVGGSLTEYQLLQGMLMGSAGNYAAILSEYFWGSRAVFSSAAMQWLDDHAVSGITIVGPTGFDSDNTATPEALITVARLAMADPTIAEIVATKSVDLPGAGTVENTNELLADPGVIGVKTGSLVGFDLLASKQVTIGETTVRIDAVTLNQPTDELRWATTRELFAQVEKQLEPKPAVAAGTRVGTVRTLWGERVPVVTAEDTVVVLWNGSAPSVKTTFALADSRDKGDAVGKLTATGPLDAATVTVQLAEDVEGPGFWWRVTHPLELLGLS